MHFVVVLFEITTKIFLTSNVAKFQHLIHIRQKKTKINFTIIKKLNFPLTDVEDFSNKIRKTCYKCIDDIYIVTFAMNQFLKMTDEAT